MQPMCCCGKRREDNLATLFTTGFGSMRPQPNEDMVSITFDLGVALTCLLTLAGEKIRDRLFEQRAPNCQLTQTDEELFALLELTNPNVSPDKLNYTRNAEADQLWKWEP